MDTTGILKSLTLRKDLNAKQTAAFLTEVIHGTVLPSQLGAALMGLKMKGETPNEILGFVRTMRTHMIHVNLPDAIDVCGTGGDGSGTFNVSTAVSFVVAGAGIRVAKHGNRAASSQCGSADVLEELGVNLNLTPFQAKKTYEKVGMVFLFAPIYHSSLKNAVEVRKQLKIPTVFNILGPFANPSSVKKQMIGVPRPEIVEKLSDVARHLHYDHLLIVSSEDGLDELSVSSDSIVYEIKKSQVKSYKVNPTDYGFKKTDRSDILGSTKKENAEIIKEILDGKKSTKRDIVLLNSAFALYVAGLSSNVKKGIRLAEKSIDSGKAKSVLQKLVQESQKYA